MLQELAPHRRRTSRPWCSSSRRACGSRRPWRRLASRSPTSASSIRCWIGCSGPRCRSCAPTLVRSCCCRASATRWSSSPRAARARGRFWAPANRPTAAWLAGRCALAKPSCCMAARTTQPSSDHPRELASSVVVPLALSGRLVGVMNASREPGAPRMDEQAARLLELLANQAAILIDSVQMLDELQRKDQRLEQLVDQLLGETGRRPDHEHRSAGAADPTRAASARAAGRWADQSRDRAAPGRRAGHVKDHVQSIIKKLGATDRTHAAVIAVRGGIVS